MIKELKENMTKMPRHLKPRFFGMTNETGKV